MDSNLSSIPFAEISVTYRRAAQEWECQIFGPREIPFYGEGLGESVEDAISEAIADVHRNNE